jgi:DNA-dependent protein kinase catalytic subunit
MYKILMWAYDSYRSVADVSHFLLFIMFVLSRDEPESEMWNEIVSRCREILLRGLSDDDLPMRSVFPTSHVLKLCGDLFQIDSSEFLETQYQASWRHYRTTGGHAGRHVYTNDWDRLPELCHKLAFGNDDKKLRLQPTHFRNTFIQVWIPGSEEILLFCSCTWLIYSKNYPVSASWYERHAAMTPLFLDSLASQSAVSVDGIGTGQVRATQDVLQFTPTQAEGIKPSKNFHFDDCIPPGEAKGPYNWLTQSSLDTFADSQLLTLPSLSDSSLLFTVGSRIKAPPKRVPAPDFTQTRTKAQADGLHRMLIYSLF